VHAPQRQPNLFPGAHSARRKELDTLQRVETAYSSAVLVDRAGLVCSGRSQDATCADAERRERMQELDAALFARVLERRRQDQAQRRI
jgi:hypothetical protein